MELRGPRLNYKTAVVVLFENNRELILFKFFFILVLSIAFFSFIVKITYHPISTGKFILYLLF